MSLVGQMIVVTTAVWTDTRTIVGWNAITTVEWTQKLEEPR